MEVAGLVLVYIVMVVLVMDLVEVDLVLVERDMEVVAGLVLVAMD